MTRADDLVEIRPGVWVSPGAAAVPVEDADGRIIWVRRDEAEALNGGG